MLLLLALTTGRMVEKVDNNPAKRRVADAERFVVVETSSV